MKYPLLLLFLCCFLSARGQNYTTPAGEFMDTSQVQNPRCENRYNVYYYSINGKYPKSAATLLKEVHAFLEKRPAAYSGSGYITFHFQIDCEGNPLPQVRVTQTDEAYKPYRFDKALVNELYLYYKTLDQWKAGTLNSGEPTNYHAFVSFKIKDGKVVNVIP